ncbi:hypothetical protein ACWGJP_12955 [Microbacterium sp. NPDC055903]
MIPRIPLAAASTLVLVLALASCAAPETPEPTASAPAPAPTQTTAPVSEETPEPEAPAEDPTCETIISEGTVSALQDLGWSAEKSDFVLIDGPLEGGIYCAWANWEEPSDHGQFFAWAPLDASAAAQAQSTLVAEGWIREDGTEGSYLTEDPSAAFQTDEDGYGMTYLFGDGWVKFADTKQSLILIDWP